MNHLIATRRSVFPIVLAALLVLTACGGGGPADDETATTASSPTTAATSAAPTTRSGGYDVAGYHLEPVDPASIGFDVAAGTVSSATAFEVTSGGAAVGSIVQAILPEGQEPTDETLVSILEQVSGVTEPQKTPLGPASGYVVETPEGGVVVASLLEDGSLQFVFGADRARVVTMIEALSTAQPGAS